MALVQNESDSFVLYSATIQLSEERYLKLTRLLAIIYPCLAKFGEYIIIALNHYYCVSILHIRDCLRDQLVQSTDKVDSRCNSHFLNL